ncbi:hypothetical protein LSAT2_032500, partial [Lamellibrachia satsuma]
ISQGRCHHRHHHVSRPLSPPSPPCLEAAITTVTTMSQGRCHHRHHHVSRPLSPPSPPCLEAAVSTVPVHPRIHPPPHTATGRPLQRRASPLRCR